MAEMKLTKKGQKRISRLLNALGADSELRERFERDAPSVLHDFGLGRLIPDGADLEVELEVDDSAAQTKRLRVDDPKPTHLDLAHIDQSNPWPDPLPPTHFDWAHTDAVLLQRQDRAVSKLRVRGRIAG